MSGVSAEDFFLDAWDIESRDTDFSGNQMAQSLYGLDNSSETAENVEHFEYPEKVDDQGRPYVTQSQPVKLFAEQYRDELEDGSLSYPERFEAAITVAEENDMTKDQEILEETMTELGL